MSVCSCPGGRAMRPAEFSCALSPFSVLAEIKMTRSGNTTRATDVRALEENGIDDGMVTRRGHRPTAVDVVPLLLDIKEAAKRMGVSRTLMYRLIKQGLIRPIEVQPGMRRIRTADLETFVAKAEVA